MVKTELGRAFLAATAALTPAPRVLLKDPKTERYYSPTAAAKLDANVRKTLVQAGDREVIDLFYNTYHGTPLAYARAINLIGTAGVGPGAGQRLADFGFGSVGQLRMLASLGFDTIGIEVSPFLVDLYSDPADQGPFGKGSVKMTFGHFPADALVAAAVGGGLDVFLSKNTLKRGYIHPYRTPGKPEWVIKLGVTDEVFLRTVHDALKPGGLFMIYNICPAPTPEDKPFVTWTDGRSPFTRDQLAAAGFQVIAFDVDDTDFVREMGRRLHWDRGADADGPRSRPVGDLHHGPRVQRGRAVGGFEPRSRPPTNIRAPWSCRRPRAGFVPSTSVSASEARKTMTLATSSGVPTRPRGIWLTFAVSSSGVQIPSPSARVPARPR